eukprot:Nk52_evm18s1444 gene=Nk52_evmTU18s1444
MNLSRAGEVSLNLWQKTTLDIESNREGNGASDVTARLVEAELIRCKILQLGLARAEGDKKNIHTCGIDSEQFESLINEYGKLYAPGKNSLCNAYSLNYGGSERKGTNGPSFEKIDSSLQRQSNLTLAKILQMKPYKTLMANKKQPKRKESHSHIAKNERPMEQKRSFPQQYFHAGGSNTATLSNSTPSFHKPVTHPQPYHAPTSHSIPPITSDSHPGPAFPRSPLNDLEGGSVAQRHARNDKGHDPAQRNLQRNFSGNGHPTFENPPHMPQSNQRNLSESDHHVYQPPHPALQGIQSTSAPAGVPKYTNGNNPYRANSNTVAPRTSQKTGGIVEARKPPPTFELEYSGPQSSTSAIGENTRQTVAPDKPARQSDFVTAKQQLVQNQKDANKKGQASRGFSNRQGSTKPSGSVPKKSLGARRTTSQFVAPFKRESSTGEQYGGGNKCSSSGATGASAKPMTEDDEEVDERLKGIDPKMIELISNEIMDHGPPVDWDDIAGLEFAKKTIMEIVVWPMLRPDIFTGLRGPPKGLLLFGPPGTGKTLIGKCIASKSGATFFSISASSLTSKWIGEGEKMVRALFAVARTHQPAVIFIDEIDSLLSQRSDTEHEASRRIKTEFLIQLDGATTSSDDRILVVGATNRPQEIDEAARRRLVKRLYIPLPEVEARKTIVRCLLKQQGCSLNEDELAILSDLTKGYSGADMSNLCKEAALGPIRAISDIRNIDAASVRPINMSDFHQAIQQVRASVSDKDLKLYIEWNNQFGCTKI